MGNGLFRFEHPAASRLTDAAEIVRRPRGPFGRNRRSGRLKLRLSGRWRGGWCSGRNWLRSADVRHDVIFDDAAARTGSGNRLEIDAVFGREALDQRRSAETLAGSPFDRG